VGRPTGAVLALWGETRVACMMIIFVLNEIWMQDKIYSLVGTLLG
jgi:hypothetical protein